LGYLNIRNLATEARIGTEGDAQRNLFGELVAIKKKWEGLLNPSHCGMATIGKILSQRKTFTNKWLLVVSLT
jgi:hypothetical protein